MDNRVIAGAVAVVAASGAVTYVIVRRRRQSSSVASLAQPVTEGAAEVKGAVKVDKKAQKAAADKAAADKAAAEKAVADAVAAARAAADQMADDQPKVSRRAAALAAVRPAATGAASQVVRFADDHQADIVDVVTLILTRNRPNPSPTDPGARRQAELMVEQALTVMKMVTEKGASENQKSSATPGAAPA